MLHGTTRRTPLRLCALALILVALLAACGGDAVPGEDADTEAPAPEATDRVPLRLHRARLQRTGKSWSPYTMPWTDQNWEDSGNWLTDAPLGEWSGVQIVNGRVTLFAR